MLACLFVNADLMHILQLDTGIASQPAVLPGEQSVEFLQTV
jgi:hypothetical protein